MKRLTGYWPEGEHERGSATITTLVAMGMFLIMLTLFTQFAVWQYGRGVVRSAALEAARSESVLDAGEGACLQRFEQVRADLLGGQMGEGVGQATCAVLDDRVVVTVTTRFERWLPISPDWEFTVTAVAAREVEPE